MNDNQSQTESMLDIIRGVDSDLIMLPEFQRDFRWDLDRTYDLFDSLSRDIFIGTIIYGKPAFGMTLRALDRRPRKGKDSRSPLPLTSYSSDEIRRLAQTKNLRVVLDGQQRLTSIYRALKGHDSIYAIARRDIDPAQLPELTLENLVDEYAGEESPDAPSIAIHVAYQSEAQALEEADLNERFAQTSFGKKLSGSAESDRKPWERIYRRTVKLLVDLFKKQKLVAFYLLDMNLAKFCVFFERSNSRGIQLNFTDILAAKLYHGFNLRKAIDDFGAAYDGMTLSRETVVRAVSYLACKDRGITPTIDKGFILAELDAPDFQKHWDLSAQLYAAARRYLLDQKFVLSEEWLPVENMVLPLMMLVKELQGFDRMSEAQRRFLEYWYWASIFANRYSGASNEIMLADCAAFASVARGEKISLRGYFAKLRPLVQEPDDLLSYTKRTSVVYRGALNLLGYSAHGLLDWNSKQKLNPSMSLEDHHIFPRAYIESRPPLDTTPEQAQELVDCVANRTLIPKILNVKIGRKPPGKYLKEIAEKMNPSLAECLQVHLIPSDQVLDGNLNSAFHAFLRERAARMFALIHQVAIEPAAYIAETFASATEDSPARTRRARATLAELLRDGRVHAGAAVFVRKHPDKIARIRDAETVEYEGQSVPINRWGMELTGWASINIYDNVFLKDSGLPLGSLRDDEGGESD